MLKNDVVRRVFLPYCVHRVEKGHFVILNRNYKPIGQINNDWVEYRDHMVRVKYLGPPTAKRISCHGSPDLDRIYLYNDGCIPTSSPANAEAYNRRLNALMALRISPVGGDG